jgi:predicted phage terminase large subunit-like protein
LLERLPQTRLEAIQFYRLALTAAAQRSPQLYRNAKRWLARNDLFFLLTVICKRSDLNHDWLFARCREVQANPNGFLDLWAREHYKSTIITFGLSLQDILASHGEDPEPRYGGREVTIGIFSYNRPLAKDFLKQIKRECETNEELKSLFPDILWESPKDAPKWSEDDGLIFRRRTNPREATVEAWGLVDGQPIGKHFFIVVYDDVVTDRSVTEEMIPKTTAAWELSQNLGTEGGWYRYIGTRYHLFDTYSVMIKRGIPPRIYACTSDGSEDFETKAVLRSAAFLRDKREKQGPYTFGAQMLLNPKADTAQGFREEWLRYWKADNTTGLNFYILVDPASKKKKTSDYTAMWVIGAGGDKNFYVVDGAYARLNLRERATELFKLHRKWRPLAVGYEEYGIQADVEHIEFEQELKNYRFSITRLGGQVAKPDRIKRLVPVFEQGRMFLPKSGIVKLDHEKQQRDIVRQFVDEEYSAFPVGKHDDALDCMSRILDADLGVMFPEPTAADMPKWMADELEGTANDFMNT